MCESEDLKFNEGSPLSARSEVSDEGLFELADLPSPIVWELFFRLVKEKFPEKVKSASNRRLLEAFTRNIKPGGPLHDKFKRLMQRRKRR